MADGRRRAVAKPSYEQLQRAYDDLRERADAVDAALERWRNIPTAKHVYLPLRSDSPGNVPSGDRLGAGQVALNFADRKLWIGLPDATLVEVTSIDHLLDLWQQVIAYYKRPPVSSVES